MDRGVRSDGRPELGVPEMMIKASRREGLYHKVGKISRGGASAGNSGLKASVKNNRAVMVDEPDRFGLYKPDALDFAGVRPRT